MSEESDSEEIEETNKPSEDAKRGKHRDFLDILAAIATIVALLISVWAIATTASKERLTELDKDVTSISTQQADLSNFPVGTILIWNPRPTGNIQGRTSWPIPGGWQICNGENGTPDLRDKFIMGSDIPSSGSTGGTAAITQGGEHSHEVAIGKAVDLGASGDPNAHETAGDNKRHHEHSASVKPVEGHNHGGENRPPYHTLVFIMRTPNT